MRSSGRFLICLTVATAPLYLAAAQNTFTSGKLIANNKPNFVGTAPSLGRANPAETIEVGLWLKPHNRAELDSLADELYDPASPNYRRFLTAADVDARFAPTAEEARKVQQFLTSRGFSGTEIGPHNLVVRARGTVAGVENAFRVQIENFQVKDKVYRSNTSDPYIEGDAADLVASVSGLNNLVYSHPLARPTAPTSRPSSEGRQNANGKLAADADPGFFTSHCFGGPDAVTFSGGGVSAKYWGKLYNPDQNPAGCGYTPPEIWTAYNLNSLYKEGYDGTGQTIVIIDWCGSPTIQADANAFSARFGLPPLTSSNFTITYPSGVPQCGSVDPEINIDVEWAHAIAPGAKINLVVPPSPSFLDVDYAELYAVALRLGNVISGSYGSQESFTPPDILDEENMINEVATVVGISANFASGDAGDFTFDFASTDVQAPADSPYATAVGGVSLALKPDNTIAWQTGWGTNYNILGFPGEYVEDPPVFGFFNFGSGGGPSAYFSKPAFQHKLAGTQRLLPDISWLADPLTGGVIAITSPFVYPPVEWETFGGTSLACPMFSALWAIANQEAGAPLGQAAKYVYTMPTGTIRDVVPIEGPANVVGKITDFFGTTRYTADELASPLAGITTYYSAIWNVPFEDEVLLVTFGTDSHLQTAPGWDPVTGVGTPNGKVFADHFRK
jgi:subtilase family serine protease